MKKILYPVLLFFISINIFYAQTDRKYDPVQFENLQYQWLHPVIDSSLIDKVFRIDSQNDTIFYDGFSTFYGTELYRVDPVIYNGNVYIFEQLWKGWGPIGTFVQCIDIKTGKTNWQTHFYNEDNRKELSRYAYINDQGQLEILGMKELKGSNCNNCYRLIVRKYDPKTGALLEKINVSESNQQAMNLYGIPFGLQMAGSNFLFPYNTDSYMYAFTIGNLATIILNDSCQAIQKDTVELENDYKLVFYATLYKTQSNNFLYFQAGQDTYPYPKDSLYFQYHYFDKNMNILKSGELGGLLTPTRESYYYNVYRNDDYFILMGIDSVLNTMDSSIYDMGTYSMFDIEGDLIEQVSITDDDGNPFDYGDKNKIFGKATKLKYDDGMLIIFSNVDKEGNNYLNFIKTDGQGHYQSKKQIKLKGKNHSLDIIRSIQLENGDFIISFLDINNDLIEGGYNSFATVYALFSAEDLGVTTFTDEADYGKNEFEIYPNPTNGSITLNSFKEKFNNVIVYDINGKKVYKTNIGLSNTALMNLTFLKNGIYAIKILKDNKQLGIMKFVKGE